MITKEQIYSLFRVVKYRPLFASFVFLFGVVAALFEAVGLAFLIPIIELTQSNLDSGRPSSEKAEVFVQVYEFLAIPFTIEYIILGAMFVMLLRYSASLGIEWARELLRTDYERHIKTEAFEKALESDIEFIDRRGADEILNAVITQAANASQVIKKIAYFFEVGLLSLLYLGVALYMSPMVTVVAIVIIGGSTLSIRKLFGSGEGLGGKVADANEELQGIVQAGIQGVRDIRLFNLDTEFKNDFRSAMDALVDARVTLRRNKAIMNNLNQFISAASVFLVIYVALRFTSLSLSSLGVFLFAMFRLSPRVSTLNHTYYQIEAEIPHLVRTQRFIDSFGESAEKDRGERHSVSTPVEFVGFDDVSFSYSTSEPVLRDVSFTVNRGEYIAFVGQSGAGKSTIVSLLSGFYQPDSGRILVTGDPLEELALDKWRDRIGVVRQDPYLFSESLRYNLTLGHDLAESEIEKVCEITCVTEFIDDLPQGYETELGDEGIRLSGGQRQRVALARALLRDIDILILDEATSDLDTNIEREVQEGIESMDRDIGVVAIAHRLSTVKNFDRIYTMEDGQVIEAGTHTELLSNDGVYASFYTVQQ